MMCRFRESNPIDLSQLLFGTRTFEASDPKDKIFAVLGLATLGRNQLPATEIIRVDYQLTTAEVFLSTAWAMIHNSEDLFFIAEVEDQRDRNIADLPTWVPDFSSLHRPSIYHQSQEFKADKGLLRSLTSLPNTRLLGTVAYKIGEVLYADSLGRNEAFIEYFPRMLKHLCGLSQTYVTGEDRLEVLWRTMIQNGMDWNSPAPAETAHDFRIWILSNMTNAVIEADRGVSPLQHINVIITMLELYSQMDPTGIMPTQYDIRQAVGQPQEAINKGLDEKLGPVSRYGHELVYYQHMRIFRTNDGLLGLGQPSLQTGDALWIIPGISTPMVLRSIGAENRFNVVGPAYVHGIMFGEAVRWARLDRRSIILE